jgi:hypothetical protein
MGYHLEYVEARKTLDLSARTASRFVKQLGAIAPILLPGIPQILGRRPDFQATVLDQKYWFAKLYELVSYEEIQYSSHTDYPGFSLHFMKVFYGLYYQALQNYFVTAYMQVPPLWMIHFSGPPPNGNKEVEPDSTDAIQFSVRTGATAHIQGDMPVALVKAYKSWNTANKPAFADLRQDFIVKSENAFKKAQARFYIEVNDKTFSPFRPEIGQLGAVYYQNLLNIQPSLPVMFQWRRDAWDRATIDLRSGAASH